MIKRYCKVIGLKDDLRAEYERQHANVWPGVNAMITACHMSNFTVFTRQFPDDRYYLVMYFEYSGSDFEADMRKMAADPETQRWWALVKPCQEPFPDRSADDWWVDMRELCHHP